MSPATRVSLPRLGLVRAGRAGGRRMLEDVFYAQARGGHPDDSAHVALKHAWLARVRECDTSSQLALELRTLDACIDYACLKRPLEFEGTVRIVNQRRSAEAAPAPESGTSRSMVVPPVIAEFVASSCRAKPKRNPRADVAVDYEYQLMHDNHQPAGIWVAAAETPVWLIKEWNDQKRAERRRQVVQRMEAERARQQQLAQLEQLRQQQLRQAEFKRREEERLHAEREERLREEQRLEQQRQLRNHCVAAIESAKQRVAHTWRTALMEFQQDVQAIFTAELTAAHTVDVAARQQRQLEQEQALAGKREAHQQAMLRLMAESEATVPLADMGSLVAEQNEWARFKAQNLSSMGHYIRLSEERVRKTIEKKLEEQRRQRQIE